SQPCKLASITCQARRSTDPEGARNDSRSTDSVNPIAESICTARRALPSESRMNATTWALQRLARSTNPRTLRSSFGVGPRTPNLTIPVQHTPPMVRHPPPLATLEGARRVAWRSRRESSGQHLRELDRVAERVAEEGEPAAGRR